MREPNLLTVGHTELIGVNNTTPKVFQETRKLIFQKNRTEWFIDVTVDGDFVEEAIDELEGFIMRLKMWGTY